MSDISKEEQRRRKVEELRKLGELRGFTEEYQQEQGNKENRVCHKQRAPATDQRYDLAVERWKMWMLSRNEPEDRYFTKEEPDPPNQILKLFSESYIAQRKGNLPSQHSVCHNLSCFIGEWEKNTCRKLPNNVKDDVYNYIRTELTQKYGLETKHREKFLVTARDLDLLLRHLFEEDGHDYVHERYRFQEAFALSLFSNSGARAGAIVESSAYRGSNESLYYKHLSFNLQWGSDKRIKYWVTIDPEFLKGHRYDEKLVPKTWIREQEVLGRNFAFYVIVAGIVDKAFKGIRTIDELLARTPPKGRESWTLQWEDRAQNLPVLRMVTSRGVDPTRALTFSSIRHGFMSLAQRACFQDPLRIHGIRGSVANAVDLKASEATRSQALDHQNPDTYLKYQSKYKRVDIQASFWNLEPDYECLHTEESMSHHRDPNVPQRLDAAATAEVENDEEMIELYRRIDDLTNTIGKRPHEHDDLVNERAKLYNKAAKKRRNKKKEFIANWWNTSYDEYIAGNEFTERDQTCIFNICRKYMPERDRLRDNLFTKASLGSKIGRQCLQDMVKLCTSDEKVAYYPGETPIDGRCPVCQKEMSSFGDLKARSKHILQCRRKSLNAAPYQQRYQNGKRAHRRAPRSFLEWCYLCAQWFRTEEDWQEHCRFHLDHLEPRCGPMTFRYTMVAPGFCPFCLGDESKKPEERFQQWRVKSTLINHIDSQHLSGKRKGDLIECPHPCCLNKFYEGPSRLRRHFFDAHSIEEPRRNCVSVKRKWIHDTDDIGHQQMKKVLKADEKHPDPVHLLTPASTPPTLKVEFHIEKEH